MDKGYIGVVASTNEQIIYADLVDTEKEKSYKINQTPEFGTFMLDEPEPIKGGIKFGIFKLGKIKGDLGRKDLYEDR